MELSKRISTLLKTLFMPVQSSKNPQPNKPQAAVAPQPAQDKPIPQPSVPVFQSSGHPNYIQFKGNPDANQAAELRQFHNNYQAHYEQYVMVANRAKIPAPLVSALHWREGSGSFHTYLHQGDKLGKPAVNEPNNIPVFPDTPAGWEDAAVHAIGMKEGLRIKMGITASTTDLNVLCDFAENYNGLGYRNKGIPSPYVLAGCTGYEKGKYIADHVWDPNAVDKQLGVLIMLRAAFLS